MSSKSDHDRLAARHAQDPHCHWCGRETYMAASGVDLKPRPPKGFSFGQLATRDHLKSRNDGDPLRRGPEWVLACYRCNNTRAAREQRRVDPDLQKKRSNPWKWGYLSLRHALAVDPDFLSRGA